MRKVVAPDGGCRLPGARGSTADAFPVGLPVRMAHEAQVDAAQVYAVRDELASQQRQQLRAELRLPPGDHGFRAETRRIAEVALASTQREPGKESELDVTDQREFAAGGASHGPLDAWLESVRIDQPYDHQHADEH